MIAVFDDDELKYMHSLGFEVKQREEVSRDLAKQWRKRMQSSPPHPCKDRLVTAFLLVGGK